MSQRLPVTWAVSALIACAAVITAPRSAPAQALVAATAPWPEESVLARRSTEAHRRPLFATDDIVEITLTADFKAVNKDRSPSSVRTFPATLTVPRADGSVASIPSQIRTRGHSRRRLQTCSFAPLRLEFDPAQSAGTLVEGHKSLKLGTHCRDADLFAEYVPREYAVYRLYNLLTPYSFRARLVRATYIDAGSMKPVSTRLALFTENDDDVARRVRGRILEQEKVTFRSTSLDTTALMTVFQYFIGNTDLSIYALHNVRLVQRPKEQLHPVPYDFDYSGLVDSRYAVAAKEFNLSSPRERLYRGPCLTLAQLQPPLTRLRELKMNMLGLYDTIPGLDEGYRRKAKAYLEGFYKLLEDPKGVKKAFMDGCNGRAGM